MKMNKAICQMKSRNIKRGKHYIISRVKNEEVPMEKTNLNLRKNEA